MTRILIGADVGGSKTAVGVSDGDKILARAEGAGAAVRPGRALASASDRSPKWCGGRWPARDG